MYSNSEYLVNTVVVDSFCKSLWYYYYLLCNIQLDAFEIFFSICEKYHSVFAFYTDDITWLDAPTEQYPIAGTSYKVRCKVKANPAPMVDWYKQDTRIVDGNRYVKDIDGLLIQNVTAEDDGIYKCRAIVIDTGNIQDRDIRVEVYDFNMNNNTRLTRT